jgi:hypothetical protein|tara:strand:- start:43616 stop:43930 length:315 start_codon:yes stop_codon:yes gene_type:complete
MTPAANALAGLVHQTVQRTFLGSKTSNVAEPDLGTSVWKQMDGGKNCRSSSAEFSSAEGVPVLVAAPESSGPKIRGISVVIRRRGVVVTSFFGTAAPVKLIGTV